MAPLPARGPSGVNRCLGPTLRSAAALALGLAAPLAFAPFHLLPLLFLSFGGLFLLLERTASVRSAFLVGWLFGLGSFVAGLGWITEAFAVDADRFGALPVPALIALASGLGVFPAMALAAARALSGQANGARLLIAYLVCWACGEWLRGTVLTGFPWNLAGHAWGFADAPLQLAAVLGIYGLGLVTVAICALPALALATRRWWPLGASLAGLVLLWIYGVARLAVPLPPDLDGVRLRLVQTDVAQSLKWEPTERARNFAELIALSTAPGAWPAGPTHLIWPETAVPFLVAEEPAVRAAIADVVPSGGAVITGAVRRAPNFDERPSMRNSLLVIDGAGEILGGFDKVRLVPFGEFIPLREWLPGVPKLTDGAVDFSPGPTPTALPVPGLPAVWPLICYEAIFPARLPGVGPAAGWILTVTNDAWFGRSRGPHQHALAARVRAVELGLPMLRAANGGISFVTDAYGRERARLPLGTSGALDTALPAALPGGTPYGRVGDLPFLGAIIIILIVLTATRQWRR